MEAAGFGYSVDGGNRKLLLGGLALSIVAEKISRRSADQSGGDAELRQSVCGGSQHAAGRARMEDQRELAEHKSRGNDLWIFLCGGGADFSGNDRLEAHAFCSRERAVGRGGRNAIGRLRELRCADRASFLRRWDEHGIGAGGNVQFADA